MATLASALEADLTAVIAHLPATLVWGAQTITVILGDVDKAIELEMGGPMPDVSSVVQARVSTFSGSTTPPINTLLTVDGATYRVLRRSLSPDGIMVTLFLGDKAQ